MKIGADYYPEHWPMNRWPTDAKLMKEAGIALVRVGEFAWARFEPEPGRLTFDWLDKAIDVLADQGIDLIMGTPTATPPKWLCDRADESGDSVYQVDSDGRVRGFGTRRHYCFNHPGYREESKRIVEAQAAHYAGNGAIVAWQIDNEFGCHDTTVCYCDHCRASFAAWLEGRYNDVDALNAAWGTVFWSQTYRRFDEVVLPAFSAVEQPERFTHNPGLLLDYQRFSSDSVVDYQKLQIDVIRSHTDAPITHNFMGHFNDIDYYDLAADLEFVSWDNYPQNQWNEAEAASISMAHDITRGTRRRNFWVMEQLSGPCGWAVLGPTPAPGQIRLWSYQGVAHGADAIVYFRWRPALFGTEQYWYGILDHDGESRRRYREVADTADEFARVRQKLEGTEYPADVLLLRNFDNLWSQRFQPHADGLVYDEQLQDYYTALSTYGAQIDVHMLPESLVRYKIILAPMLNLTTPEMQDRLDQYVRDGGTLVLTFRSGTRTNHNAMRDQVPPGPFADMAGVTVEEFDALSGARVVGVAGEDIKGKATLWIDVLKAAADVEVLARYTEGYYEGSPAITRRHHDAGTVYYVGCDLDSDALSELCVLAAESSGAVSVKNTFLVSPPDSVEAAVRSLKPGARPSESGVLFLLNHGGTKTEIHLRSSYRDLLRDETVTSVTLEPYGVAVLEIGE